MAKAPPRSAAVTSDPATGEAGAASLPPLPERYEDALSELEALVVRMETGALPLDQLLDAYRRGAQLLTFCRGRLDALESQVKVLEDGQLKPWTDA